MNRYRSSLRIAALVVLAARPLLAQCDPMNPQVASPNIILIIADDLGWGALPFFNRPINWDPMNGILASLNTREHDLMSPTLNRLDARMCASSGGVIDECSAEQGYPVYPVDYDGSPNPTTPFYFSGAGSPCYAAPPPAPLDPDNCKTDEEHKHDALVGFGGLKRLANEGLTFQRFYATAAVCLPTRASMMTGRHGTRTGATALGKGENLPASEVTIAEYLKNAPCNPPGACPNYVTGIIGKWHVSQQYPWQEGFDEAITYDGAYRQYFETKPLNCGGGLIDTGTGKCNLSEHTWDVPGGNKDSCFFDTVPPAETGCPYTPRLFSTFAEEFIEKHTCVDGDPGKVCSAPEWANKRFFLVVAVTNVHDGHQAINRVKAHYTTGTEKPSRSSTYWALVEELDALVGRILTKVDTRQIADNTLVMFISDQGPDGSQYTFGDPLLRGKKATPYDGGIRVPFLARLPCNVRGGETVATLSSQVDMFRTIAEFAGRKITGDSIDCYGDPNEDPMDCPAQPTTRYIEGISLHDALYNPSPTQVRNLAFARVGPALTVVREVEPDPMQGICGLVREYNDFVHPPDPDVAGATRTVRASSCTPCSTDAYCQDPMTTPCKVLGMRCVQKNPGQKQGLCVVDGTTACFEDSDCGTGDCLFDATRLQDEDSRRCLGNGDCAGTVNERVCRDVKVQCDKCFAPMWKFKIKRGSVNNVDKQGELYDLTTNPEEDQNLDCNGEDPIDDIRDELYHALKGVNGMGGFENCEELAFGADGSPCDPVPTTTTSTLP